MIIDVPNRTFYERVTEWRMNLAFETGYIRERSWVGASALMTLYEGNSSVFGLHKS